MATLHGFPILVTGQRWCVVDMPDSWAIMDSLDTVPKPVFRFQKDESGWRDAVAQLQRSDAAPPVIPTVVVPPAPPPVRHGRRQFSLARFGILLSSAVLGVSAWLPWATIQAVSLNNGPTFQERGDLFTIMSHGWRNSVAEILVGLAVIGAVQALVFPFPRISLVSAVIGFLSLAPVIIGTTQIHTYVGSDLHHPKVAIGYGVFVALGGCLLMIMAWAIFPTGLRRFRTSAAAPELAVVAGPTATGPIMEGLAPTTPPPPPSTTSRPAAQDAAQFSGLPTLGAALAQLAEHDRQAVVGSPSPSPVSPEPVSPESESRGAETGTAVFHRPESLVPEPPSVEPEVATITAAEPSAVETESVEPPAGETPPAGDDHPDAYPSGWYADYADPDILRYWDGAEWTEHTHPATVDH